MTISGTTVIDGYRLLVDGVWRGYSYQSGAGQLSGLLPGRTYTVTVQAKDKVGDLSPASEPLTVTTPADVQSPTTPTGLVDQYSDPASGIFVLDWNRSTDNVDLTAQVQHRIYANGRLVQVAGGLERGTTVCLDPGSYNFTRSGPSTVPAIYRRRATASARQFMQKIATKFHAEVGTRRRRADSRPTVGGSRAAWPGGRRARTRACFRTDRHAATIRR